MMSEIISESDGDAWLDELLEEGEQMEGLIGDDSRKEESFQEMNPEDTGARKTVEPEDAIIPGGSSGDTRKDRYSTDPYKDDVWLAYLTTRWMPEGLTPSEKRGLRRKSQRYEIEIVGGEHRIYRWEADRTGRTWVLPPNRRYSFLKEFHEVNNHLKCPALEREARSRIWMPKLREMARTVVQDCQGCLRATGIPQPSRVWFQAIPNAVWGRIHVDVFFFQGKPAQLVVDSFSKFTVVDLLRNVSADETIRKMKSIFQKYGPPVELVSDNGTNYTANIFEGFLEEWGVIHIRGTPGKPSTNSLAENKNGEVKRALARVVQHGESRWMEKLPDVVYTINSKRSTTTGLAPCQLMFNRDFKFRMTASEREEWRRNREVMRSAEEGVLTDFLVQQQKAWPQAIKELSRTWGVKSMNARLRLSRSRVAMQLQNLLRVPAGTPEILLSVGDQVYWQGFPYDKEIRVAGEARARGPYLVQDIRAGAVAIGRAAHESRSWRWTWPSLCYKRNESGRWQSATGVIEEEVDPRVTSHMCMDPEGQASTSEEDYGSFEESDDDPGCSGDTSRIMKEEKQDEVCIPRSSGTSSLREIGESSFSGPSGHTEIEDTMDTKENKNLEEIVMDSDPEDQILVMAEELRNPEGVAQPWRKKRREESMDKKDKNTRGQIDWKNRRNRDEKGKICLDESSEVNEPPISPKFGDVAIIDFYDTEDNLEQSPNQMIEDRKGSEQKVEDVPDRIPNLQKHLHVATFSTAPGRVRSEGWEHRSTNTLKTGAINQKFQFLQMDTPTHSGMDQELNQPISSKGPCPSMEGQGDELEETTGGLSRDVPESEETVGLPPSDKVKAAGQELLAAIRDDVSEKMGLRLHEVRQIIRDRELEWKIYVKETKERYDQVKEALEKTQGEVVNLFAWASKKLPEYCEKPWPEIPSATEYEQSLSTLLNFRSSRKRSALVDYRIKEHPEPSGAEEGSRIETAYMKELRKWIVGIGGMIPCEAYNQPRSILRLKIPAVGSRKYWYSRLHASSRTSWGSIEGTGKEATLIRYCEDGVRKYPVLDKRDPKHIGRIYGSSGLPHMRSGDPLGIVFSPVCGVCKRADRDRLYLMCKSGHFLCPPVPGRKSDRGGKLCSLHILAVITMVRICIKKGEDTISWENITRSDVLGLYPNGKYPWEILMPRDVISGTPTGDNLLDLVYFGECPLCTLAGVGLLSTPTKPTATGESRGYSCETHPYLKLVPEASILGMGLRSAPGIEEFILPETEFWKRLNSIWNRVHRSNATQPQFMPKGLFQRGPCMPLQVGQDRCFYLRKIDDAEKMEGEQKCGPPYPLKSAVAEVSRKIMNDALYGISLREPEKGKELIMGIITDLGTLDLSFEEPPPGDYEEENGIYSQPDPEDDKTHSDEPPAVAPLEEMDSEPVNPDLLEKFLAPDKAVKTPDGSSQLREINRIRAEQYAQASKRQKISEDTSKTEEEVIIDLSEIGGEKSGDPMDEEPEKNT